MARPVVLSLSILGTLSASCAAGVVFAFGVGLTEAPSQKPSIAPLGMVTGPETVLAEADMADAEVIVPTNLAPDDVAPLSLGQTDATPSPVIVSPVPVRRPVVTQPSTDGYSAIPFDHGGFTAVPFEPAPAARSVQKLRPATPERRSLDINTFWTSGVYR